MFGVFSTLFVVGSLFSYDEFVYAATFNFVQSSWVGGADAVSVPTHTLNRSNWTKYASSTGLTMGTTAQIPSGAYAFIDDGATSTSPSIAAYGGDFLNGVNASTAVSGSGAGASVELVPSGPPLGTQTDYAVGVNPQAVAFDPFTHSIWVVNNTSSTVTKLNATTGALVGTYSVGTNPRGIAFDSITDSVWITSNNYAGTVTKLNATTGALVGTYAIGTNPYSIVFDSSSNALWTNSSDYSGVVNKISLSSGGVIGTYSAGGGNSNGITFDSSSNSIWVSAENNAAVYKLNASTGAILGSYTVTSAPMDVVYDSSTASVWTVNYNYGGGAINKIDASTGAVIGSSAPGAMLDDSKPKGIAFDSVTNSIWVANEGAGTVLKFSAATGALFGTFVVGTNPTGVAFDSFTNSIWVTNSGSDTVTKITVAPPSYPLSGTFTSAPINLGSPAALSTLTYSDTVSASTTLTMDARAGNTATPDGTWTAWTTGVTSGASIAALGSKQYVQYRANLSTSDSAYTPLLNSVSIGYSKYGTGSFLSSIYDSGDPTNLVTGMKWTGTGTTTTETIKFQVRSASTTAAIATAPWCGMSITCDGTSYFTDSTGRTPLANNHPLRSGGDDRYFQYQAFLASGGAATPILTQATVQYVVNAPPQFDTTYGTNGVSVVQDNATSTDPGAVLITYKVRDPDTTTGTVNPGYVTPSFEYNTGSGWVAIPAGALATGDTANKAVDDTIYNTYTATWAASSTLPSTFASTTQVRVTANDNEGANNTAQATSASFIVDTKAPTISATLDASAATSAVSLTATDNSQLQYRLCNSSAFPATDAQGNSCAWSALSGNLTNSSIAWTPHADAASNEPVYIQVQDAFGNVTASMLVAPGAPGSFDIKDVSNTVANTYKEFLSWSVFTATTSTSFNSYKLYTSTDGATFTLLSTITNPALNYYADTITTATTSTHYYKAVTTTTQGNTSSYTATLSDLPNGQGGTDTTPPVITPSSILAPSATLKNTSAFITFATDELSQGTAQYRKSGDTAWTTVSSLSYSLAHSIYLQGLSPNTIYNLQVRAVDVAGNVSAYQAGPDFTTVGGPVITNVSETNLTDTSVSIVWNTSTSSDSYVFYSANQNLSPATTLGSAAYVSCVGSVCQHKVDLAALTSATTYYFYVSSTDGAGNVTTDKNADTYYRFHTTLDLTPPVISNISEPVLSSTAAVLVWQTDKPSSTQVDWGTTSGQLNRVTVFDSIDTIYHVVSLSSATNDTNSSAQTLTAATPYYFKAFSVDAAGNTGSSTEQTFSTVASGQVTIIGGAATVSYAGGGASGTSAQSTTPPVITSTSVDNIGAFNADVHVATDKNVMVFVEYGGSHSYGSIEGDDALSGTKTITLNNLQEGTMYHYRVKVVDQYGNSAVSQDQTFKTIFVSELLDNRTLLQKASDVQGKLEQLIQSALPSLAPPFITTPVVSSTTENSVTVTWTTNIKTYGSLRYATDAEYVANQDDYTTEVADGQTVDTTHTAVIANLTPNTLYHLQARAYIFPQVVGKTEDITFITKAAPITANIVDVENTGFTVVWQTDEPTSSIVEYKNMKTGSSNLLVDNDKRTYHNVHVQNLPSGTPYSVTVSGVDGSGNKSVAAALRTTTVIDFIPPAITNFKVENALIPGSAGLIQTVIGWQTSEPANSIVSYEEGVGAASTTGSLANKVESLDTYTTAHVVILPHLKVGTVYRLKVVSADPSGNEGVFGPTSIITPNQSQSVLDIIVKNFEDTFQFLGARQ